MNIAQNSTPFVRYYTVQWFKTKKKYNNNNCKKHCICIYIYKYICIYLIDKYNIIFSRYNTRNIVVRGRVLTCSTDCRKLVTFFSGAIFTPAILWDVQGSLPKRPTPLFDIFYVVIGYFRSECSRLILLLLLPLLLFLLPLNRSSR